MLNNFFRMSSLGLVALTSIIILQTPKVFAEGYGQVSGRYDDYDHHHDHDHNGSYISYDQAYRITEALYRAILFREGDQAGIDYWARIIMNGPGTDGLLSAAQNMAQSSEFMQNVYYRRGTYDILNNIYNVFYHRNIDPSGLNTWGQLFRQGRPGEALRQIVGSEEFRQHYLMR